MVAAAIASVAGTVGAQLFRPQTVAIENVRIVVGDGTVIERGTVVIRDGRLVAVGSGVAVPDRAARVDGSGKTVTPGLIDALGSLGSNASGGSDGMHFAADAFDRFDTRAIRSALSQGVTTVYLPARGERGVTGVGAVVRFTPGPDDTFGEVAVEHAALCVNMGSGASALQRLQMLDALRKRLKAARTYRESLETYESELEDYEKKIKERAANPAQAGGPGGSTGAGGTGGGSGQGGSGVMQDPPRPPGGGGPPGGGPRGGQPGGGQAGTGAQGGNEELRKPQKPRRDAGAEMILKAIDREMPVRVYATRQEDILNAIELAQEFNLRLIIEGAAEADLVAAAIDNAGASVVFDHAASRDRTADGLGDRLSRAAASAAHQGLSWYLGSGRDAGSAGRFLLAMAQHAANAAGHADAISLLTGAAADLLELGERTGRLTPGREADLVLWSGDPLDPSSKVELVYINGSIAWRQPAAKEGSS